MRGQGSEGNYALATLIIRTWRKISGVEVYRSEHLEISLQPKFTGSLLTDYLRELLPGNRNVSFAIRTSNLYFSKFFHF